MMTALYRLQILMMMQIIDDDRQEYFRQEQSDRLRGIIAVGTNTDEFEFMPDDLKIGSRF